MPSLRPTRSIQSAALLPSLALLAVPLGALGAVEGDRRGLDPLLSRLEGHLDAEHINVLGGDARAHPLGERPRVARLAGMPLGGPMSADDLAAYRDTRWAREFEKGTIGFVAGVKQDAGAPAPTLDELAARWAGADPSKRVFLSFTKDNVEQAHKVAAALHTEGYVTFVYLRPEDASPPHGNDVVARYFREAGAHYVIDSPGARRSPGVWLEARVHRILFGGGERAEPGRGTFWEPNNGGSPDDRDPRGRPGSGPRAPGPRPGAGGAGRTSGEYDPPRMNAQELRNSPHVLDEAGGVMFDAEAEACAAGPPLTDLYLDYDADAQEGSKIVLRTRRWYTAGRVFDGPIAGRLGGFDDDTVAAVLAFVRDGRPVLVNIQRVSAEDCPKDTKVDLARVLVVSLNPALAGTAVGRDIAQADALPLYIVRGAEAAARAAPDSAEARAILAEAQAVDRAGAAVSNVNDVDHPATVCLRGGAVGFSGAPAIELLYAGLDPKVDPPQRADAISDLMTRNQSKFLGDEAAYQRLLDVWRLQSLLRFFAAHDPASLDRLARRLGPPRRDGRAGAITWSCESCTGHDIEALLDACPKLRS